MRGSARIGSLHGTLIDVGSAVLQVRHAALWRVLSDSLRLASA